MTKMPNEQEIDQMSSHRKLQFAEQLLAVSKQMVANGQHVLDADTVKAMRELDGSIKETRKLLGLTR